MYNATSSELRMMGELMEAFGANIISYLVAAVLSSFVLTYAMRWFIFKRAGEKGWKGLIPFLSDYVQYKIAWDGRIYIALLVGQVAATLLGAIFGMMNVALGTVVGVILNTAVMGANAVTGMILNFKLARAFGRNDYFAVGLYFLNSIFCAILAFGSDAEYKGPQKDGIGVPKFIDQAGQRASAAAAQAATKFAQQQAAHQAAQQAAQQQQSQYAPAVPYTQQPGYHTGPQQPVQQQGYGAYPQMQQMSQQGYQQQGYPQQPVQRTGRRAQQNYNQYDQQ